jgi:hypothetical protein
MTVTKFFERRLHVPFLLYSCFDRFRPSLSFPQSIRRNTFLPDTLTEAGVPPEFYFPEDYPALIAFY